MKSKRAKIQEIKRLMQPLDELTVEEIELLKHHGVTVAKFSQRPTIILQEQTVYESKIIEGLKAKFPDLHCINVRSYQYKPCEVKKYSEPFYLREA